MSTAHELGLPKWLDKFASWNQANLRALREVEAELRETKGQSCRARTSLQLHEGQWDASKHPRLGAGPNAGWFASAGGATSGGSRATGGSGDAIERVCFAAGTLVLTDGGFKPIEQIARGDRVLAASEDDAEGPTGYQTVEEVFTTRRGG